MTIGEALQWARRKLADSPTPHEDARLLLQHVLGVERSYLAGHPETPLAPGQEQDFRDLVARAERREPIPYITGTAAFYDLDFVVTPAVLIPRPETELLVEAALTWAEKHRARRIVDVGTGSGCLAVVLARHLPLASVLATDVSAQALAVARRNALRHDVAQQVRFVQGSLMAPVAEGVDLVVANLPYVADAEWTTLDDAVKLYEPAGALRGGPHGLDLIRRLLKQARDRLRPGGAIFLEIGWRQGAAADRSAQSIFPTARITVKSDYSGHDRLVLVETNMATTDED